ncbi:MAG: 50S ribosomal protein L34e [Promethearchaeota archaeon]
MPRPGLRSKSQARHDVKTPGNRTVTHYWRKKPKKAHCAACKKPLQSIPRKRPAQIRKMPRTKRRANRPQSGRYCARCLQTIIQQSIWNQ